MKKLILACAVILTALFSCALADIVISEVMASNGIYQDGHAYDWIELHNTGNKTVDLSGWMLSDKLDSSGAWQFPKGTKLKKDAHLVVYCTGDPDHADGKNSVFYAPFKVSASGETLALFDKDGNLVQSLLLPKQYGCVSYGCDKNGQYGFFENATKGKKNDASVLEYRLEAPRFDISGGFYQNTVTVTAHASEGVLRYTTDGSTPTKKSKLFPEDGLTVKKTTPIRIRAFSDDAVSSETVSATYFINDDPVAPVVSLITDKKYMFDTKTGALVKGTGSVPNYDKELEYPTNIEYYNEEGVCAINQMGTFTASGHSARQNTQKSIAIYARKAYGKEYFEFNPFPTRDYTQYKSLLLRSTNSDAFACRLRDVVASSLAEGQGLLYQDAQCIQVYITGEYWGHYNLREKINKYMIAQYEHVEKSSDIDKIDILARTGSDSYVQNGDNADWLELCDFCAKNDLNVPENLAFVEERLDIDNMFTHAIFEICLGNSDFTNVRVYRVPGGKWKYLLFDVEACFHSTDRTPIEYYIKSVKGKIQGFRHEPLNALLNVPEYKDKFLKRMAEILETCFNWPYVKSKFDFWEGKLELILERHIARWKNLKYTNWQKNISAAENYARWRPKEIPGLIKKAMKLTDAEYEYYFGETMKLLNQTNPKWD